jgi:hypothetical protein
MLDSIWGGADALVTPHTASRFTVVLVVTPDPYWGDVEPAASYRGDILATCGAQSWWQQEQHRREVREKLAVAAERNDAVLVDLDRALGRFSLANDGTAFEARCNAYGSHTPAYNTRGVYATADVVWQCLESADATYDVPKMLAS